MAVNRAVRPTKPSGEPAEIYELVNIPKPKASPKNVVVKVLLRPVNPTDFIACRYGYWEKAKLDAKNIVVGSEGFGIIDEVGEGVTKFKVGQRVIPLAWGRYYSEGNGLWRDYIELPETDIIAVPDNMSDEIAAQFLINPWTGYGIFKELNIPKGEYFLQTAASSVLGREMISLAKYDGIKSINIVRRDSWIQPLKDLGADYVINQESEDVTAKVLEITGGKGAYAAADAVAGKLSEAVAASLRPGALFLVYGILSSEPVMINIADLTRGITLRAFGVSDHGDNLPLRYETSDAVFDLLSKKVIDPSIGKTYPLEQFKEAMEDSEKANHGGKLLLSSY